MDRSITQRPKESTLRARAVGPPDMDPVRLRLALARMPARLRGARRRFHNLTGLTVVTSLRVATGDRGELGPLSPPVHPRCAEKLRTVNDPPCEEQWERHLSTSQRAPSTHTHVCPLGLRCLCVPIYLGERFLGVAKLVVDARTPAADFSEAAAALALTISLSCHESYVAVLRDELQMLRRHARGPRQAPSSDGSSPDEAAARAATPAKNAVPLSRAKIVDRTLDYLRRHHQEPDLSLQAVAAAAGCNGRYLTHLFTQVVGQRMHGYLVGLRVERVCRELLDTDRPIKQIAFDAGFGDAGQLTRAFHRHVGVSPSVYRRVFGGA